MFARSGSQVARDYGVSQSWSARLIKRCTLEGDAAFQPRSRAGADAIVIYSSVNLSPTPISSIARLNPSSRPRIASAIGDSALVLKNQASVMNLRYETSGKNAKLGILFDPGETSATTIPSTRLELLKYLNHCPASSVVFTRRSATTNVRPMDQDT